MQLSDFFLLVFLLDIDFDFILFYFNFFIFVGHLGMYYYYNLFYIFKLNGNTTTIKKGDKLQLPYNIFMHRILPLSKILF